MGCHGCGGKTPPWIFWSNLSLLDLFLGSGESDLHPPPPKKKKKTAVFVAFFLGGGFQHTMAEADESILDFVIHQHDMKREVPASRIQNARSRSKEMYVVLNANQSTWI